MARKRESYYYWLIVPRTLPAPVVTGVTPSSGPAVGGTAITDLAGTDFQSGATVTFGGVAATSVTFVSATKLTCVTPAGTAGAQDVVVTNPDGQTSGTSGNGLYTYVAAPVVTGVTPSSGSTAGGTAITDLAGTDFQSGATVTFGGVAATSVVFVSATRLTCVTPAGTAGAQDIVVTNPDGQTSGASGNGLYTYVAAWTPAQLNLTSWQSAPFTGLPWAGTASVGISATEPELMTLGIDISVGAALNGNASALYTGASASTLNFTGDGRTNTFIDAAGYSFSILTQINITHAPAANPYENGCFMSQRNGNPAWGLGHNTLGFIVWHYDTLGIFNSTSELACPTGAPHLIQGVFDGSILKLRIDGGIFVLYSLNALDAASIVDGIQLGSNSYNAANPLNENTWERWTSKQIYSITEFDLDKAYINSKYGMTF